MKSRFLYIVVFFIIMIPAVFFTAYDNIQGKKMRIEYPRLKLSEEIMGRISSIQINKGTSLVTVDSTKFRILMSVNYNYEKSRLPELLSVGDSIVKMSESDTITIYSDDREYYFVHEEFINK